MERIWANRLWAGTKTWDDCPTPRKPGVEAIMRQDVAQRKPNCTAERFEAITGKPFVE